MTPVTATAPPRPPAMASATVALPATDKVAHPAKNFVAPLVRQFLDYLKLEKHFSDYTGKSYGADLIQFCQFLTGEIGSAALDPANARFRRRCRTPDEKLKAACEAARRA